MSEQQPQQAEKLARPGVDSLDDILEGMEPLFEPYINADRIV